MKRAAAYGWKWMWLVCTLGLLGASGCFQLETRVKVNEDGTAVVTERLWFSERLLDLAGDKRGEVKALLGRERVLERLKQMGEGVTLVKHETHEGGDGWMESVAEFAVVDLSKFRYVSPWLAYGDYPSNNAVRLAMTPLYKSNAYGGGNAGNMVVHLAYDRPPQGSVAPPELTPLQQQVYRDIAPAIRDMLKGFKLRFTFEPYAPVGGAVGKVLLDVSDTKMDQLSQLFFENEEIMLELARMDLGGPNVANNVFRNPTLPTFLPHGSRAMWWVGSQNLWFAPSQQLFDKYFAGKKLDLSQWQASPPDKHVPATFEEVGWHPPKADATAAAQGQALDGADDGSAVAAPLPPRPPSRKNPAKQPKSKAKPEPKAAP
jgi:hypothetical protein